MKITVFFSAVPAALGRCPRPRQGAEGPGLPITGSWSTFKFIQDEILALPMPKAWVMPESPIEIIYTYTKNL